MTVDNKFNLDDKLNTISTKIFTSYQGSFDQGSGFFFQEYGPGNPSATGGEWRPIEKVWLVTNRHILFSEDEDGNDVVPDTFTFHLRKVGDTRLEWHAVTLTKDQLIQRAKVHQNPEVDVAVIQIYDLLQEAISQDIPVARWTAVSEKDMPGTNKIKTEVTDDALVIGYPKNFYDQVNLFPIIKSGIIATRWGGHFDGYPYFLIDAKLFPGSSGSLVISKPVNQIIVDGQTFIADEKQYAFLGVYSGEPSFEEDTEDFNLGTVWYSYLVVEIIKSGLSIE